MDTSKMALIIRGHEIWLEKANCSNNNVDLAIMFGHNMRQDGVADAKRLKAFVYFPDGRKLAPLLIPEEKRNIMRFDAEEAGYYTAIADLGSIILSQTKDGYERGPKSMFKDVVYAGAFHQMAKTIIQMNGAGEFKGTLVHGILEIVPKDYRCQVGQETELQVFYEGSPLAFEEVKAVSKIDGAEKAVVKTDEHGTARLPITTVGDWMFLVRHRDPAKKVSEMFDESVFVTTLVMEAK
ncbi:MAG: DUF4198 domain-containing protein [Methanotrichaceae archaeon]